MRNQFHNRNTTERKLWTSSVFLLVFGAPLVTGVSLSPCGADGIREIFYDQAASLTCTAERQVQWRLQIGNTTSILLSSCHEDCVAEYTFRGLFTARIISSHTSTMTINPINNTALYNYVQVLGGSLECTQDNMSGRCGLDYVHPPERVRCTVSGIAWSVNLSCDIGGIFSLRGNYKCQLIRHYNESQNSSLETVTIVTSPTSEKITENEVKMSGVCQFKTTLPVEEGIYSYSVSISPGMQIFSAREKWFTVERPRRPTIFCYSQPYVLENTEVNCTCTTTSLGQPAGLLLLTTGNQTRYRKAIKEDKPTLEPHGIYYTQTLRLLDHLNTWFRCDVSWGTEAIQGNNHTAQVGYAARTPRLSVGGREELLNQTVMEGNRVHFVCQSDGRPTATVHIYSLSNDTEVWSDLSPGNYTFIARCEDAATYKCYAKNSYSTQSNINKSVGLDLFVRCKPRNVSIDDFAVVTFGNKTEQLNFQVVAYPVPHEFSVRFLGQERNNTEDIAGKVKDSEMSVTCKVHVQHRYLSTCTLAIFSVPFLPGFYKVQVANEHGDQNFTVEIRYAASRPIDGQQSVDDGEIWHYDDPAKVQIIFVGVAAAVVVSLTAVVLIALIVNKKKRKGAGSS